MEEGCFVSCHRSNGNALVTAYCTAPMPFAKPPISLTYVMRASSELFRTAYRMYTHPHTYMHVSQIFHDFFAIQGFEYLALQFFQFPQCPRVVTYQASVWIGSIFLSGWDQGAALLYKQ